MLLLGPQTKHLLPSVLMFFMQQIPSVKTKGYDYRPQFPEIYWRVV